MKSVGDKVDLKLDWATHAQADYACRRWHYSKCIPKSKLVKIGVWENGSFIGVVIFGVGATNHLGSPYGLSNTQVCELVRVALNDHVSSVSKIISISIKILKKSNLGIKLIVSFADLEQGHHGGIYQATNWIYSGRSEDCKYPVFEGKTIHPRVLSHMVSSGRIKDRSAVPLILKMGKHRYLMPLDNKTRQRVISLSKPYPKRNALEAEESMHSVSN